jgi:hypothetical protein
MLNPLPPLSETLALPAPAGSQQLALPAPAGIQQPLAPFHHQQPAGWPVDWMEQYWGQNYA